MARNDGPIQFKGSLGNIRSYYDKGLKKTILSTKGGANRNLIKNNPAFARTRDCMNEFAGCSRFASLLRRCLLVIRQLMYARFYSGVVRLSKEIQVRDLESSYGYRSILASKATFLLREINLNRDNPFQGVIRDAFGVVFSQDKRSVSFSMLGFIPQSRISWPTRFSSFRLYLVIGQIADMVWNESDKCYEPVVKDLGKLTRCTISGWMPNNSEPVDILLEASFDEPALSEPGTTVIVALGIEMATGITDGSAYIAPGNGTVGIIECFV